MSSTNRSNARDKHISDYYITPVPRILEFLDAFNEVSNVFNVPGVKILDPCAGGDHDHDMSYPSAIREKFGDDKIIETMDIREDSRANYISNYLQTVLPEPPDVIITNPPFNIALDIVKKALMDVRDRGYVIMLLRLNFFGSNERFPFFNEYMPRYTFVHHKRISFVGGATDSIEYMHAVWQNGWTGKYTELRVI